MIEITVPSIKVGMICTEPLINIKNTVVLPAFHRVHPLYLREWTESQILYSEGELLEELPVGYSEELPGYLSLDMRYLLHNYYSHIQLLKKYYGEVRDLKIQNFQSIASFWSMYILKDKNTCKYFSLIRYALTKEEDYFYIHTMDVMLLSLGIYMEYTNSFSYTALINIAMGALIFDIGMFFLPQNLLKKTDFFTDEEREEIKKHPIIGFQFLTKKLSISEAFALPALEHHERPDGSGYPRGLTGDYINPNSIIIALADVCSSQIRKRSFKDEKEPIEIMKDFIKAIIPVFPNMYSQYITALVSLTTLYPATSIVRLSTGDIGIITQTDSKNPGKPIVQYILNNDNEIYSEGESVDLSKPEHQNITIVGVYTKEQLDNLRIVYSKALLQN